MVAACTACTSPCSSCSPEGMKVPVSRALPRGWWKGIFMHVQVGSRVWVLQSNLNRTVGAKEHFLLFGTDVLLKKGGIHQRSPALLTKLLLLSREFIVFDLDNLPLPAATTSPMKRLRVDKQSSPITAVYRFECNSISQSALVWGRLI